MLTAQDPFITMRTSAAEWALSLSVGVALYAVLAISAFYAGQPANADTVETYAPHRGMSDTLRKEKKDPTAASLYPDALGMVFLGFGGGPAHEEGDGSRTPRPVRTNYLLPFEIVSVHLLIVLIGAAYLARAKRRRGVILR
jgi:NADH-quinone oxidoreductase subunit J